VRSSRPFASLRLEFPAVTVAERAACLLTLAAGAFAAALCAKAGQAGLALSCVVVALAAAVAQVRGWTQSRSGAATVLESDPLGNLQLRFDRLAPVAVTLGPSTRILGPSVFLDLHFVIAGRRRRHRRWLLQYDVPADVLRRWTVFLPRCGRVACS
jgi:hypothetical protein